MLILLACADPLPPVAAAALETPPTQTAPAPTAPAPTAPISGEPVPPTPQPAPHATPEPAQAEPTPPPRRPLPPDRLPRAADLPDGKADYAALVAAIEAARGTFADAGTHAQARDFLLEAVTSRMIPAWKGTPWAFYGTAEKPGADAVACGYWVASILRDAGFRVSRNHLGKQASERILLTYAEPKRLRHFGERHADAIARVQRDGAGLWGVGLANHTGFLWNDGETVRFCHSDYHGNQGPRCEPAERSWAFRTSYTVIAPLLADATLDAWFEGRALETGKFGG